MGAPQYGHSLLVNVPTNTTVAPQLSQRTWLSACSRFCGSSAGLSLLFESFEHCPEVLLGDRGVCGSGDRLFKSAMRTFEVLIADVEDEFAAALFDTEKSCLGHRRSRGRSHWLIAKPTGRLAGADCPSGRDSAAGLSLSKRRSRDARLRQGPAAVKEGTVKAITGSMRRAAERKLSVAALTCSVGGVEAEEESARRTPAPVPGHCRPPSRRPFPRSRPANRD